MSKDRRVDGGKERRRAEASKSSKKERAQEVNNIRARSVEKGMSIHRRGLGRLDELAMSGEL